MSGHDKKKIGRAGEDLACAIIESKGYVVLSRNYTTKFGEIDIVAVREREYHFIEVKTRVSDLFGYGEESVSVAKRRRIEKSAEIFMERVKDNECEMCFDVIDIEAFIFNDCFI